jgi:hypothetical protein
LRFITILTPIGYRLYLFTSLIYTNLTDFPWFFHTTDYFSEYRKYLTCSDFSTRIQCELGTLSLAIWLLFYKSSDLNIGLYSLQSCLTSGKFFLLIDLTCWRRTIAAVNEIGF